MKITMMMTVLALALVSFSAQAAPVASKKTKVEIARVVTLIDLEQSDDVRVALAVQDFGGSTDVSPTQQVFLTLYAKGEMFSTDATFAIAPVLSLKSAKTVSPGVYEVVGEVYDESIHDVTYTIDANQALKDIKALDCGGEFDCAASTNFKTKIDVTSK